MAGVSVADCSIWTFCLTLFPDKGSMNWHSWLGCGLHTVAVATFLTKNCPLNSLLLRELNAQLLRSPGLIGRITKFTMQTLFSGGVGPQLQALLLRGCPLGPCFQLVLAPTQARKCTPLVPSRTASGTSRYTHFLISLCDS